MKRRARLRLLAISALVFATAAAQDEASLDFEDFVGVWNMVYENGRMPSLAISRDDDGTPRILVTSEFGTSRVRDIAVEGDEITFNQDSSTSDGTPFQIEYRARLVDGKLVGTVDVVGLPAPVFGWSDPFTATRAE